MDSYGREHMILNFYVQGSSSTSPPINEDRPYLDSVVDWAHDRVDDLDTITLNESIAWSKERVLHLLASAKRAFKYLSGDPLPSQRSLPPTPQTNAGHAKRMEEGNAWSFAGLFSGLRGRKSGGVEGNAVAPDGKVWNEGEVHADLVQVCET